MKPKPKKFFDRVHDNLRLKQCSSKSEQAYLNWIKQYILFNGEKHPQVMGTSKVEAILTCLVVDRNAAAATQNQAFSRGAFRNLAYFETFRRAQGNIHPLFSPLSIDPQLR
jgi:hypothetical protein